MPLSWLDHDAIVQGLNARDSEDLLPTTVDHMVFFLLCGDLYPMILYPYTEFLNYFITKK